MVKYTFIQEEIEIPSDISAEMNDNKEITLKGSNGEVTKDFSHIKRIDFSLEDDGNGKKIVLSAPFPKTREISKAKTAKNLILNLIKGVQKTYTYKMKIVYSHFPITVVPPKKGDNKILIKNFIGERAPRVTYSVGDVSIKSDKEEVIVSGCDKEYVGQTCANIQLKCRIRDKDKRVFQDGIYVYSKSLGDQVIWKIR